ncbi:FAD-dependent oxidoreductase [Metabacillus idriensis]|uniref:FAD-dependent oxidoreductase n=1 Tax=Metabacillus idriensis TaxID=324768 RepID=A0A6I2MBB3_9BACI|nr:FAD-dependent oxidoreductase [Metabacillus idriensis]MCM3597053.1 FAD-dependent oxidoreductase [Metabacillus idriensis]MRX55540.1 FAD-dependent oxidoreductase [Metabacillus idriensis]OHR64329.1 FAD-dependent oxidoreductase [Bacillus sp. HMSC76G11]
MTKQYDIVVVGGGPAGINAAIAAGRKHKKVLLVERHGFLGGMSTIASVYPWMTYHTENGTQVIKGIAEEIVQRLKDRGASPGHLRDTCGFVYSVTPYDPEVYKVLAVEMLEEAGADLLVHSFVDHVEVENDHIQYIEITSKSGRQRVYADVFVDTSGDADIAYLSGAPTLKGRDDDQKTQPLTMKFRMRGVDLQKVKEQMIKHPENFFRKTPFEEIPELPLTAVQGFYKEWKEANLPINRDQVLFFAGPAEDEVLVNMTRVQDLDGTKIEDLTKAEFEGRKQVLMVADFLNKWIPGFENASISSTGAQIGIRESRRIEGEYVLTKEDVVAGRKFDAVIAKSGYPIDIHAPSGRGMEIAFVEGDGSFDIPYGCLVPKKIENLLVAGRCMSASHEALATTRLTPSAMAAGQAAGTAAALAHTIGTTPSKINVKELQKQLVEDGMVLRI